MDRRRSMQNGYLLNIDYFRLDEYEAVALVCPALWTIPLYEALTPDLIGAITTATSTAPLNTLSRAHSMIVPKAISGIECETVIRLDLSAAHVSVMAH